jgi:hypothetical protein
VIAVEGGSDLSLLLNPEMTIDSAGQWKVLHRRRPSISFRIAGLMPPEELESYLNSVGNRCPVKGQCTMKKRPASEDRAGCGSLRYRVERTSSRAGVTLAKVQRLSAPFPPFPAHYYANCR